MLIKKLLIFFILSFLLCNFLKSQEIIIISKVGDEIITNTDVENEKKYLLILNNNLNKLSKNEFYELSKNSLIREIIKKKEVYKTFNKNNETIENELIKNFYNKLGFNKKKEFVKFLDKKKIKLENLKEKLVIETLWNQIILNKFKNRIRIDENLIEKQIINYYNTKGKKFEYNLSEIVIENVKDIDLKKKEILNYIEQYGFKIAANKFSKSDTSKYGGEIGWIKSSSLLKKIEKKITSIKIGEISEPIQTSNAYLFLKLNDKREIKEKLNLKKEIKQQIKFETNRQLNQFSLNYYKKLKKNINIYENK